MPPPAPEDTASDPLLAPLPLEQGYRVLDRRYVLYETLGAGGMGVVYKGRHAQLEVDVAIKCLEPSIARRQPKLVERFHKEARSAARIRHENVVEVKDVSEADGIHYLVMEFVRGEDARKRVARKRQLGIEEAAKIALSAARGLAAAHDAGMVHRDIKPDNILIGADGSVKVADLGLAKTLESETELTVTGAVMGTPRYMPPEQFADVKHVGPEADVYSLGATLYFLLAGTDGIRPGSYHQVRDQVEKEDFPDPREVRPEIPDALAELVLSCTRREPSERPQHAREVAEAIERALAGAAPDLTDSDAGSVHVDSIVSPPPAETLARIRVSVGAGENAETTPAPTSDGATSPPPAPIEPTAAHASPTPARSQRPLQAALVLALVAIGLLVWRPWETEESPKPGTVAPTGTASAPSGPAPSASDLTPPRLLDVTPDQGAFVTAGSTLRLTLRFNEPIRAAQLDGYLAEIAGSSASLELEAPTGAAEWVLDWEVEDADGNPQSGKLRFMLFAPSSDVSGPVGLNLAAPELDEQARIYTRESEIDLRLVVTGARASGVTIQRNDEQPLGFPLDSEGERRHRVRLDPNSTLRLRVSAEGASEPLEFSVIQDSNAPELELYDPLDDERRTTDSSFDLRVAIEEPYLRTIELDGRSLAEDGAGEWVREDVPLIEGDNTFELLARDAAGNESRLSLEMTRDSTAPRPLSGLPSASTSITAGEPLELELTFDEALRSAALDGTPLTVDGARASGSFAAPERAGTWSPQLVFADALGNEDSRTLRLEVELAVSARNRTPDPTGWIVVQSEPGPGESTQAPGPGAAADYAWRIRHEATGIEFLLVEPGQFQMGSPASEDGHQGDESPVRRVRITQPYYLARTEVTQAQWQRATGSNPAHHKGDTNRPVEQVSWDDCRAFLDRYGWEFPTEAQWEYACRAGTRSRFSSGDEEEALSRVAWYGEGLSGSTHAVASKQPNGWGFFDMHGNVWEWCDDWYDAGFYGQLTEGAADPRNITATRYRVLRGGSSWVGAATCRSASRSRYPPSDQYGGLGLRPRAGVTIP